jgi:hypothetical protein
MKFRKVEGMYKSTMTMIIFVPIIGELMFKLHDDIRGKTAGSKVSITTMLGAYCVTHSFSSIRPTKINI